MLIYARKVDLLKLRKEVEALTQTQKELKEEIAQLQSLLANSNEGLENPPSVGSVLKE